MSKNRKLGRRQFLVGAGSVGAACALGVRPSRSFAARANSVLRVGEGTVDTTPPVGIELAGFHRMPGNERLITGIRQTTAARALVLECGGVKSAIVSLDILGVSPEFTKEVQRLASEATGIPGENIRVCVTHTHSMPTFRYLRQWGKIPEDYLAKTRDAVVAAIKVANDDLADGELHLGKTQAKGANFNRTTATWKTDAEFDAESSDSERWLDTTLYTLHFERSGGKKPLLWYHFSSHPVCHGDGLAGPDWVGGVLQRVEESEGLTPAFLQGHAGDVNPGDGKRWIGDAGETIEATYAAVKDALAGAKTVAVQDMAVTTGDFNAPVDRERLAQELEQYRKHPEQCNSGSWVDAPFAAEWFAAASDWKLDELQCKTPISAMRLGPIGFVFHSSELYSYYGLAIRKASPFDETIVVGYADDLIGYVTDPAAYDAGEYGAITVPKILDLPPFTKTAGRELTARAGELLKKLEV